VRHEEVCNSPLGKTATGGHRCIQTDFSFRRVGPALLVCQCTVRGKHHVVLKSASFNAISCNADVAVTHLPMPIRNSNAWERPRRCGWRSQPPGVPVIGAQTAFGTQFDVIATSHSVEITDAAWQCYDQAGRRIGEVRQAGLAGLMIQPCKRWSDQVVIALAIP
jgi:hypothetical protein